MTLDHTSLNRLKVALCVLVASALAGGVGQGFWPGVSPALAWFYSAAVFLGALLLVSTAALASLALWQWVLRQGGIDTQWLWFAHDPKGLAEQRKR